jgi:Arc/MetJ-type ribon-helix-helix transcriptional regulator
MHKTSVYLNDDDAEGLRRAAATMGQSQADLIRAALRKMLADLEARPKVFRSLGRGRGGGAPYSAWRSDDLYRRVMGDR